MHNVTVSVQPADPDRSELSFVRNVGRGSSLHHGLCDDLCHEFKVPTKGLSLVELLVTLSLLVVIFFFTIPYTSAFFKKNELQRVADEIKTAIHTAKMQALITRDKLVLTPLVGHTDWSEGMLLFVDNSMHQYTERDKLLHQWHWTSTGIQVLWNGFQSKDYILFTTDISCSTTNGYFMIKNTMQQQIKLIINRVGRVKQEQLC